MSYVDMKIEINKNMFLLAKYNYPCLKCLPITWTDLVKFFEKYTPTLCFKIVRWIPPFLGSFKCNSDGASKGNPGLSSGHFVLVIEKVI